MRRRTKEALFFSLFRICAGIVVGVLAIIIAYILIGGWSVLSLDLFLQPPRAGMTQGGVSTPLVGTLYLMLIVLAFSVPIGVLSAVYIVEYLRSRLFQRVYRVVLGNLAGVPSIVYGLLGLGLFVLYLNFGFSLLAAGLTLGILVLPIVITASREAIQAVPQSVREASLALGATKWQTIRHHVIPYSAAGIFTGIILSLSRAAGETAPIIMTGAAYYMARYPGTVFDSFMALPYHVFVLSSQTTGAKASVMAFGAAIVLLIIVIGMNVGAVALRSRYRKRYRW